MICINTVIAVQEDFVHPELTSAGKKKFTMDVFIPDLKLAFEYHGAIHYQDIYIKYLFLIYFFDVPNIAPFSVLLLRGCNMIKTGKTNVNKQELRS